MMDSHPPQINSRNVFMTEIANQADIVRRSFEANQTKRKHISSATAAAAQHMASLNRKRKFENQQVQRIANGTTANVQGQPDLLWNRTSHTFHSPIASFTRPEQKRAASGGRHPLANATGAPAPRITDGIVLKASPHDITISYNDVVCGKGKTTSTLVGNLRYKVWTKLHEETFTKALHEEDGRNIARSIVNAVTTSVPQGRFLSLDIHTGLWYDIGYERATEITFETLATETGMVMHHCMTPHNRVMRQASTPRPFVSKAA